MGAEDFGRRGKEAVAADVEPEGPVVSWGVGKGCVSGRCYFETGGGVDAVYDGGTIDVCGWRLFVAVAVADGRDEAEAGEALVEFTLDEVFVGIDAYDEAIAVPVPFRELLKEVSAEGGAGVREVLFVIDEEAFVLAVDRMETVFGTVAFTRVVSSDHS